MKKEVLFTALAATLALSGCRSPDIESVIPETEIPDQWTTSLTETEQLAAEELAVWWTQFDDELLLRLVQQALDENLSLQAAAARVDEALALRGVAAGERVPQVNGSAGVFETNLSNLNGGTVRDGNFTAYSVGFDASWELDLWGRIKKTVDAADANVQASIEDLRGVRALIASQVVSTYITLRELQLRQEFAEQNIERQRETLKLTKGRFDSGLVPQLDVNQAIQNLSGTEAALPVLRQLELEALRALEVLAGYTPGTLDELLVEEKDVPVVDQAKLMDLPANVLRRRPDIRAAEQRLYSAALRVGVAQADLYPRISISGSYAWESDETGNLFDSSSVSSSLGPSIFLPIFQGGRLRAQVDAAEARAVQAELAYRQNILQALQEVENSLYAYQQEQLRLNKLQEGVVAGEATVVQVRSLYENGLVTFLNVLDAERNLASLQDAAASSLGQSSRNLVSVYQAFGGGWDAPEFDPPPVKEAMQSRTDLSENEAELFVADEAGTVLTLKVDTWLDFMRTDAASKGMQQEIVVDRSSLTDADLQALMETLNEGERVRMSWTEVRVETDGNVEHEVAVKAVERISPESP